MAHRHSSEISQLIECVSKYMPRIIVNYVNPDTNKILLLPLRNSQWEINK